MTSSAIKTIMGDRNKPLKKLLPSFIRKHIKAVTFDIDGVVLPSGTFLRESLDGTQLLIKTHKFSPRMIDLLTRLKKYLWINFSSGRSLLYLQYILGNILWEKVTLTSENGNFILMNGKIQQLAFYTKHYFQKLNNIREDIKKLQARIPKKIFGFEPKHVILTIHALRPLSDIEEIVRKHDPEKELSCLWARVAYDIGSKKTTKKTGLRALCTILKIQPSQMIMVGNDQNDRELLDFGVGITVDPKNVSGAYAMRPRHGALGGEGVAEYLLDSFEHQS